MRARGLDRASARVQDYFSEATVSCCGQYKNKRKQWSPAATSSRLSSMPCVFGRLASRVPKSVHAVMTRSNLFLHGGDREPNFLAHVRGDRFAVDDLRVRADRRSDRARDARSGRGRLEGAREGGASEGGGVHGVHSSRRRGAVVSDEKVFFKASTEKSGRRALRGK